MAHFLAQRPVYTDEYSGKLGHIGFVDRVEWLSMASGQSTGTHAQRALMALRQRILAGAATGGTRLFEVALAQEFDISRTPIRAALSQLAEEGLLDRARGGGFVVRTFALTDVIDTIELRGILEGTAARFAAERGVTDAGMAAISAVTCQIDTCIGKNPQDTDLEAYSTLNVQFHSLLAAMSGSPVLIREIERVTRLPFAAPSAFLADTSRIGQLRLSLGPAQEQHKALLDAIRRGDGASAEAIARDHSRLARRNAVALYSAENGMPGQMPDLTGFAR